MSREIPGVDKTASNLLGLNEAEEDHKQFYLNNPDMMYCQIVIRPKVAKVRGEFAELLR